MLHDLGQIANPDTGGLFDTAGRRRLLSGDEFHEGGLPRTVLPYQADLVALADVEIDTVQKIPTAKGNRYVVDRNHA